MAKSLQEQLLNAGLVDAKQVKKAQTEQRKQTKQQRKTKQPSAADLRRQQQEKAHAEKVERDRQLNLEREQAAARKATNAQIRQFIRENQITQDAEGDPYSFQDNNVIRRIYVNADMKKSIIGGKQAVVRHGRVYAVVPAETAVKIRNLDAERVVVFYEQGSGDKNAADNDPYAEYEVPDDLIW